MIKEKKDNKVLFKRSRKAVTYDIEKGTVDFHELTFTIEELESVLRSIKGENDAC